MKTKIFLFFFCLSVLSCMGQATISRNKCNTCGKLVSQCPYKGKHPKPKCKTCRKDISQCQYKGKHPKKQEKQKQESKPTSKNNKNTNHEKKCETCNKPISLCQYNGKHPTPLTKDTCKDCGKLIIQCKYNGKHPKNETTISDVIISCNIPTASLFIDGINQGNADGQRTIKSGRHLFKISKEGYETFSDSILVNQKNQKLDFTLKKTNENAPTTIAQNVDKEKKDDEISKMDIMIACNSKNIHYAIIDGKRYYYASLQNHPHYVVIVNMKNAYNKFTEVVLPCKFQNNEGDSMTIVGIADKAFYKCKKIKKVSIPSSVRYIGGAAFMSTNIESISFNKGLLWIGSGAFANIFIQDIFLPDGLKEIGSLAFYAKASTIFLRGRKGALYIPKSVEVIGERAFSMSRNKYGAWFHSKRGILCLPEMINLENCKKAGLSREAVEEYLLKN